MLYFNTIMGRSVEWGTSPPHWCVPPGAPPLLQRQSSRRLCSAHLRPQHRRQRLSTAQFDLRSHLAAPSRRYFTSALPRALLAGLPLSLLGPLYERRVRPPLAAAWAFVSLYSLLAHKARDWLSPPHRTHTRLAKQKGAPRYLRGPVYAGLRVVHGIVCCCRRDCFRCCPSSAGRRR